MNNMEDFEVAEHKNEHLFENVNNNSETWDDDDKDCSPAYKWKR